MIKAVIFDMDGTLIDTEKYFRICWPKAAEHFGYHMSDEQALSLRSLGRPFAQEHFREMFGEAFDYVKVREYRKKLMEECLAENGIALKPGAEKLLAFLKEKNILRAVATASDLERTNRYLKMVGIVDDFDRLISATMVEHGKPAPDIYAFACQELGFLPEECIAVEDSPNGVLSAYRAGCKVVMVPDQTEPDAELEKLLYARADSLADLCDIVLQDAVSRPHMGRQ